MATTTDVFAGVSSVKLATPSVYCFDGPVPDDDRCCCAVQTNYTRHRAAYPDRNLRCAKKRMYAMPDGTILPVCYRHYKMYIDRVGRSFVTDWDATWSKVVRVRSVSAYARRVAFRLKWDTSLTEAGRIAYLGRVVSSLDAGSTYY